MAYDLTGMATWAKSNGSVLIKDLILDGQSFNLDGVRIETGIKSADIFADFGAGTTVLQLTNGDPGALSYSGGSVLKDVKVEVVEIAVKEKYVKSTLESKIAQMQMRAGSDPSNPLPYSDVLVGLKKQAIGLANDMLLWQGNTGSSTPNMSYFNGILTLATGCTGATTGGTAAPLSASTAIATVEAFVKVAHAAFPTWVNAGSFLYMSPINFATYYRAVFGLGSTIDSLTLQAGTGPKDKFFVPGLNVEVLSTKGLTGVDNFLMTRDQNFIFGTDLVSEDDSLQFEYLNEAQIWRLFAVYKLGAKIARCAEVVLTK